MFAVFTKLRKLILGPLALLSIALLAACASGPIIGSGPSITPSAPVPVAFDPPDCGYAGGWPCNPDRDAIPDPGWGGRVAFGGTWPRMIGVDQYGEGVDTYDLLGDVPVLVVSVADWSAPDRMYAGHLTGAPEALFAEVVPPAVVDAVADGRLHLVFVVQDGMDGMPADAADAASYATALGPVDVPVLADPAHRHFDWLEQSFFPYNTVVLPDGTVLDHDGDDPYSSLETLAGLL